MKLKFAWHTGIGGNRYYGNGTYNWGHVFKTNDGEWGASWAGGFATVGTRKEAMARVKLEVARQRRRKQK